jgi:hypothetical protein
MQTRSYVVFVFATLMVAQSALILTWGEPYPSIALPRVAGTIVNQYDTLQTRRTTFIVETVSGQRRFLSAEELFSDAPPNIRGPIPKYLQQHLQYNQSFLKSETKEQIRRWLIGRIERAGIQRVKSVHGASIKTGHPICAGCDPSNVVRDTSSLVLLIHRE